MADKFGRFTKRARRVLTLAQEEARRLNHNYIGTEHLLLGLIREENGVAVKVLRELGVEPQPVKDMVERTVEQGQWTSPKLTLAPRTKRVIELAVDEARRMGHHYIGTEHLLLGLVREGEGVAVNVLGSMGVNLEKVRAQTRHLKVEGPVEKGFREADQATYRLYPNVQLGENAQIGDYVIIGHPPRGKKPGELPVVIGDNAVIRSHTVIYAGTVIGHNFQTGHRATIREGNQIGDDVSVGTGVTIDNDCQIGDDVRFRGHDLIGEYTVIEDGCWIGPHVAITNVLHPRCPKAKECMKGPTLKRGAKIGANSTLLPDITIGEMALVGAGSVVADDVPPRAVVVGSPARVVKTIDELECPYGLVERPYEG